ncbi:MAG: VOC family protein, partial [Bacteroidota bacterium]
MNETTTNKGAFRFAYFTDKYQETCDFYTYQLELAVDKSWDRDENSKGSVFKAGVGLIEVLHLPSDKGVKNAGLDYRVPQGAFMVIQVWDIDERYKNYKNKGVNFKQEVVDQVWGHRSFSITD